jgi:hypothetical protein
LEKYNDSEKSGKISKQQKISEGQKRGRKTQKSQELSSEFRRSGNPVLTSYFTLHEDIKCFKKILDGTATCVILNSH